MRGLVAALWSLALWAAAGSTAYAHHSMASYEFFSITLEGTVLQYKFTNPHCLLVVKARGEKGATVTWHLDGDAPASVARAGFGPNTFRAGDRIKLQVQPLKDGKPGGFWSFRSVITQNGHEFSGHQCVSAREMCE